MTPITRDSGTQPQPHYCTAEVRPDGYRAGCPDWPLCVFPQTTTPTTLIAALADEADDDQEPDDDDVPGIGAILTGLLGIVACVIIVVCVLAALLPFIV
jgi:hypothetical protein